MAINRTRRWLDLRQGDGYVAAGLQPGAIQIYGTAALKDGGYTCSKFMTVEATVM